MDYNELLRNTYAQWRAAKELRRIHCERCNREDVAQQLAMCELFKGTETVEELAKVCTSPHGIEFCLATGFPNIVTFRLFKSFNPERFGIYIDAGTITLHNPETAVLIGRTSATIRCDSCSRHDIIAMHGGTATVLASKWAVVRVQAGAGSNIVRRTTDNAVIL